MKLAYLLSSAVALAFSTAAVATSPAPSSPGAATISTFTDAYDPNHDIYAFGTAAGNQASRLGTAQAYAGVKLSPYAALNARGRASAIGQTTAYALLDYDYLIRAGSQAAYDALSAYAQAHGSVGAEITGRSALRVLGTAYTSSSIDAGTGTMGYACDYTGGVCSPSGHLQYQNFQIGGLFTSTDPTGLTFLGHISMNVRADASGPFSTAYAFIDPLVSLPSGFGGSATDYSIELSPSVGNGVGVASVPEPASWAMLIAGFGMAGAAMRRRRRVLN